jgi:tape measure domain-containing protein
MDIFTLGMKADTRDLNRGKKDVEGFARAGQRAETGINRSTKSMSQSFNQMAGFIRVAQTALVAFGAVQIIKKITAVSDEYANISARLKLVTKDSQELEKVQTRLFKIAQSTSTEFSSVADLYTKVARASKELGTTQEQVLSFTQSINQAFQVSGASTAEAAGATRQLAQALQSGVLRGDEFNSINEQGGRIMEALADGLNVARSELRGMAEAGRLTANLVLPALLSQAEKINAEFEQMPRTVGRATTELGNAFDYALASSNVDPLIESFDELRIIISDPATQEAIANLAAMLVGGFAAALSFATSFNNVLGQVMRRMHGPLLDDADAIKASMSEITAQIEAQESKIASVSATGLVAVTKEIAKLEEKKASYQAMLDLSEQLTRDQEKATQGAIDNTIAVDINIKATIASEKALEARAKAEQKAADASAKLEASILAQLPALREQIALINSGYTPEMARYMSDLANATSDAEREQIKLNRQLDLATDRYNDNQRAIDELSKQVDPYAQAWASAMERVDAAFASAWEGAFDSFESFSDALLDSFKKLLAEMAHLAITKPIVLAVSASVSAGATAAGAALGGAAGQGLVGGAGAGLAGFGAAGAGAEFGGSMAAMMGVEGMGAVSATMTLAPYLSALTGALIGFENSGAKGAATGAAGGFFGAKAGAAVGSMAGPIGTIAGAVIGGALGALGGGNLFGSGTRQTDEGVGLGVTGGELSGFDFINKKKSSGYKGTRSWSDMSDLDTGIDAAMSEQLLLMTQSVTDMYSTLGITIEEGMTDSFNVAVSRIDFRGKTAEQIQVELAQWLEGVAGEFSDHVSDQFGNAMGELELPRLMELSTVLGSVNSVMTNLNATLFQSSLAGAQASESLIMMAGGVEAFQANTSTFFDLFYTDAEKFGVTTRAVTDIFDSLNMVLPGTRDGLKSLVQSLDPNSPEGARAFTAITSSAALFDGYYSSISQQSAGMLAVMSASADRFREGIAALNDVDSVLATISDSPAQSLARLNSEFEKFSILASSNTTDALKGLAKISESLAQAITNNASTAFEAAEKIAALRESNAGTAVAAEGFRQGQIANEILISKFMSGELDTRYVMNGGIAPEAPTLTMQDSPMAAINATMEKQNAEITGQRDELRAGLAAIAVNTRDTAQKFDRFDGNDGLNVRIVT